MTERGLQPVPSQRAALSLALGFALVMACGTAGPPLAVVPELELARYAGSWYEIASFPQPFQEGCVATRAIYSPREDGRIAVLNECRDGSFDGELRSIEGVAWVVDPEVSPAKLEVQFFWPFSGAYWVIDLDPDYRYAVVGHPSRDYLWILSREPTLDEAVYAQILDRAERQGYDLSRLRTTPQPARQR